MKAVLIDPLTRTVTDVEVGDSLREIHAALGDHVTGIKEIRIDAFHVCHVDGEGLLQDRPGPFFMFGFRPSVLCGRGLILGVEEDGDYCDAIIDAKMIDDCVSFPDLEFIGFEEYTGVENVDRLGDVLIHRVTPTFRKRVANDNH